MDSCGPILQEVLLRSAIRASRIRIGNFWTSSGSVPVNDDYGYAFYARVIPTGEYRFLAIQEIRIVPSNMHNVIDSRCRMIL